MNSTCTPTSERTNPMDRQDTVHIHWHNVRPLWASEVKETSLNPGYSYAIDVALSLGKADPDLAGGSIGRILMGEEKAPVYVKGRWLIGSCDAMTFYDGTQSVPDPTIVADIGPSVPAYRGTAYVVFKGLQLGDFNDRLPMNLSFELQKAQSNSQ